MARLDQGGIEPDLDFFGWSPTIGGLVKLGAELGFDAVPILRANGIEETNLFPGGTPVPSVALMRSRAELARLTGIESVPVRLALMHQSDILVAMSSMAQQSVTVGEAIQALAKNSHRRGTAFVVTIEETEGLAIVRFHSLLDDVLLQRVQIDYSMCFSVLLLRALVGPEWDPEFVELARPIPAQVGEWFSLMRCPVRFNAEEWLIAFDRKVLDQPIHSTVKSALGDDPGEAPVPINFTRLVDREIVRQLSVGDVCLKSVATALGISPRHLQRRLSMKGTSYQGRLDLVRQSWARHYLLDRKVSVTRLAQMLGFNEPATLTRSFVRWFGMTPRDWRQQHENQKAEAGAAR